MQAKMLTTLLMALAALTASARADDASPPAGRPVQVFILAGQSNMEGAGAIHGNEKRNGGQGSLAYLVKAPKTAPRFAHLVDAKGEWRVRDDVSIAYFDRKGGLTVGYGSRNTSIGPELQFGHVVGDAIEAPVLIIKTAWGGKSLAKDFRPPSSGGEVGPYYTKMIETIREVLKDMESDFPQYKGCGYEIAGFGWHQGWNDGCSPGPVAEYETNMVNFIRDVRRDLGVKDMPFVIANSGFGGWNQKIDRRLGIMKAQADAANHPDFKQTAACVETRDFFRPGDESPSRHGFHWNSNAETYFLIGDAMGKAMVQLLERHDSQDDAR